MFTDFFLNLYKDTFHFKKGVSDKYKNQYINKNLLSFAKTFSYDIYTGWNSVLKKIWYHDQANITNKKWKNTIYITEFESNAYFEMNINDLKNKSLKELREYANKRKIRIRDKNGKLLNKKELIKKIKI